jgi:arsenite-transporting ATPase
MDDTSAELRLRIPFVEKAEIDLKKVGLELIVRVGHHKRNIVLPSALASFRPREAKLEDGALRVRFERQEPAADHAAVAGAA